jgi:hypothetical protein
VEHLIPSGFRADVGNFVALVDDGRDPVFFQNFCAGFTGAKTFPRCRPRCQTWACRITWSFWQCEYPAVMLTDTAMYRNEHYHAPSDTPEKLDYERMAAVFAATCRAVETVLD